MADENIQVPPVEPALPPVPPLENGVAVPPVPVVTAAPESIRKKTTTLPQEPKDVFREVAETVVFVVVLVLLLKTFIAEAFVIPTGSMATTLWGYQKVVTCPECGFTFPVNCSSQVDPQGSGEFGGRRKSEDVLGCVCPNCRFEYLFASNINPPWYSGDRVLVAKFLYDSGLQQPQRHDVVVFKFPEKPQDGHVALNYIKRLIGKPGETIGIHAGKLYVAEGIVYPDTDLKADSKDPRRHVHANNPAALDELRRDVSLPMNDPTRRFSIVRKSPDVLLALSRPVYDNDHQAKDLIGKQPPRWHAEQPERTWQGDNAGEPKRFTLEAGGDLSWLRYRNLVRDNLKPELITDFMGYNSGITERGRGNPGLNWVGDLTLEFEIEITKAGAGDELWVELSKGIDRFQARINLDTGDCTLVRKQGNKEETLATKGSPLKKTGKHTVRLANVDERLTVWVDGELPFGDGVAYDPAKEAGPTEQNDLQPASIAVKGAAASVGHLKLARDTYYTAIASSADAALSPSAWSNPTEWKPLRDLPYLTLYVQPNHFLCMGDNSPESADGRSWGLVPERLMLGRALVVYFPFYPFGAVSRIGPIK